MATLIVTNINDAGAGSLRAAVTAANASVGVADTIVFAGGLAGQTITLTTGQLALTDDVTIDGDTTGDNKADITISGNNTSRIFNQSGANTDVDLLSLKLTGGSAVGAGADSTGGAILASYSGTLEIFDTTITSNAAQQYGGGIYAFETTVSMQNSLLSSNAATTGSGGGIYIVGDTLTLINTTLDGNTSGEAGGGIFSGTSTLNIINSTVTNNHAAIFSTSTISGGGIVNSGGSIVNVTNSVIAQNTSSDKNDSNDVSGTITTATNSVFGTTVAITNNSLSLTNVADVGLGALGNHGGTTQTRDILSGSVLFNAGSNAAAAGIATDANGNVRVQGGIVDVGATEYRLIEVTNLNDTGAGSLRDALTLAQARVGEDHIVFQSGLTGTILTASTLTLTSDVTINGDTNGDGDPDIVIGSTAAQHLGVIVNGGVTASLTSMGISGFTMQTGASAVVNYGNLTLSYSVISNNTVTGGGAQQGLAAETLLNQGTLAMSQTVFANNSQTGQTGLAGGYASNGGTGGSASTVLNLGTIVVNANSFSNVTSHGGSGGAGGGASGTAGNGGTGGAAVAGVLNLSQISGQQLGVVGTSSVTAGLGGAGGYSSYTGNHGMAGAVGAVGGEGFLNQGSGAGSVYTGSRSTFGDQLNNSLYGSSTYPTFGFTGDDALSGIGGVRLFGGTGNDTLSTSAGFTSFCQGGLGNDILRIGGSFPNGSSGWHGGLGIDTLDMSAATGFFDVPGTATTINLLTGVNNFSASITGIENLIGTNAAVGDNFTGSTGSNIFQGLGGFDVLDGGAGIDTLDYSEKTGAVTLTLNGATAVFQQLNGVNEDVVSDFENIIGGSGIDTLTGDVKDNLLRGGAGADTLNGGANTVVGDTLSYEGSAAFVVVNLALNTASGGDATGDLISNFENVTGSSQGDQLTGSTGANALKGGAGDDVLAGGAGADKLDGGANSDIADYRTSTGSNVSVNLLLDTASGGHAAGDTLDGIENLFGSLLQRDVLIGDNGNNILKGFGGIDSLQGGDGDDFLEGGADADAISGGVGVNDWASYRDSTVGTVSINLLTAVHSGGDAQGDTLFFIENLEGSLTKRDILIGNIVANRIIGNGGVDSIQGGDGNDFIDGGTGGDSLSGGAGQDTASYEKSSDGVTVDLNVALQVSAGDAGGDSLFFFENISGSDFADSLKGNLISNTLRGGLGTDTLNGGTGSDYLTGGADADTFRFGDMGFGSDTITDWQDGVDHISVALPLETSFAGLTFTGNGTSSVIVRGFNGTGSAIIVKADAAFTLDAGDFVFV